MKITNYRSMEATCGTALSGFVGFVGFGMAQKEDTEFNSVVRQLFVLDVIKQFFDLYASISACCKRVGMYRLLR